MIYKLNYGICLFVVAVLQVQLTQTAEKNKTQNSSYGASSSSSSSYGANNRSLSNIETNFADVFTKDELDFISGVDFVEKINPQNSSYGASNSSSSSYGANFADIYTKDELDFILGTDFIEETNPQNSSYGASNSSSSSYGASNSSSSSYGASNSSSSSSAINNSGVFINKRKLTETDFVEEEVAPKMSRTEIVNFAVNQCSGIAEGLALLRRKGLKVPKLSNFIEDNLEIEDAQDEDVNKNRLEIGDVLEKAEDFIVDKMKKPFLKALNDLIISGIYIQHQVHGSDAQLTDIKVFFIENPKNIDEEIFNYVMHGKDTFLQPIVRNWINEKDNADDDDYDGRTPLYKAILHGNIALIEMLLSSGANPDIACDEGRSALHEAVSIENNVEVLNILSKFGANFNSKDIHGKTPLHIAASFEDNEENLKMLFKLGANLDAQDLLGQTPMYEACMHNSINSLECLYNLGANPNIIDDDGIFYSGFSDENTIFLRVKEIRKDYCNRHFDTLTEAYLKDWNLRIAIINKDIDLVKKLIEQGADVNFLPTQAYIRNILDERSMKKHAYTKAYPNNFHSNLMRALILNDDIEIIKLLLKAGARPDKRSNQNEQTVLHCAVEFSNPEFVKILVKYGADPNLKVGEDERTALHFALLPNNDDGDDTFDIKQKEIIQLLLQAGANKSLNVHD